MKKTKTILLSALAALAVTSCSNDEGTKVDTKPIAVTRAESEIIQQQTRSNLAVFTALKNENVKANTVYSPLSMSYSLAMLANGAAGETKDKICSIIAPEKTTLEEINATYGRLMAELPQCDPDVTFRCANSLWLTEGITFKQDFIDINSEKYSSETFYGDLQSLSVSARLNEWLKKNTSGRIGDGQLMLKFADTDVAPVNAIFFSSAWTLPFDKKNSYTATFRNNFSNPSVNYMCAEDESYGYAEADGFKAVAIPYANGVYRMIAVMTTEQNQNPDAELTASVLENLKAGITNQYISKLAIPSFEVVSLRGFSNVFAQLAGLDLTDPANDLSGISDSKIKIGHIAQAISLTVNENGTEMAVATGPLEATSPLGESFVADRPFYYLIEEKSSGAILLIGYCVNPNEVEAE